MFHVTERRKVWETLQSRQNEKNKKKTYTRINVTLIIFPNSNVIHFCF